jgi:hypothetical protein
MTDHFDPDSHTVRTDSTGSPTSSTEDGPSLPVWLSRRLLRAGETVTWVRGPRYNPSWERYITHPALLLVPALPGVVVMGIAAQVGGAPAALAVAAVTFALVLPLLFVVGFSAGYFTRLVVTDFRLLIVQGYELCWDCGVDYLPPSLVRYDRRHGEKDRVSVDLNALQTSLGGASTQFVEAKTILAFKRQVDRDRSREQGRRDDKTLPDR